MARHQESLQSADSTVEGLKTDPDKRLPLKHKLGDGAEAFPSVCVCVYAKAQSNYQRTSSVQHQPLQHARPARVR